MSGDNQILRPRYVNLEGITPTLSTLSLSLSLFSLIFLSSSSKKKKKEKIKKDIIRHLIISNAVTFLRWKKIARTDAFFQINFGAQLWKTRSREYTREIFGSLK